MKIIRYLQSQGYKVFCRHDEIFLRFDGMELGLDSNALWEIEKYHVY